MHRLHSQEVQAHYLGFTLLEFSVLLIIILCLFSNFINSSLKAQYLIKHLTVCLKDKLQYISRVGWSYSSPNTNSESLHIGDLNLDVCRLFLLPELFTGVHATCPSSVAPPCFGSSGCIPEQLVLGWTEIYPSTVRKGWTELPGLDFSGNA